MAICVENGNGGRPKPPQEARACKGRVGQGLDQSLRIGGPDAHVGQGQALSPTCAGELEFLGQYLF